MHFTNRLGLPQYLVDWLKKDNYDHSTEPSTISATTLLKPVQAYWLTVRNGDELTIDVSELVSARLGTAIHDSIEKVSTTNVSKEQRISRKITVGDQVFTVTGKYDLLVFEDGKWILRDIKTTSVWAFIYGGKDEDYRTQLSIYRWLLQERHPVETTAFIDFIFTDWQATKARTEDGYPQQRIQAGYAIDLLSLEQTEKFIEERLAKFFQYKDTPDSELPECTKEELWASEDTWAVMKVDAKRATKVCSSEQEALSYIKDKEVKKASIQFRQGKVKRCKYCPAFLYCVQAKSLAQKGLIDY